MAVSFPCVVGKSCLFFTFIYIQSQMGLAWVGLFVVKSPTFSNKNFAAWDPGLSEGGGGKKHEI